MNGFTLLEVILALAILGLALATLGQSVGRSHESARRAADESELCLIATSVLDELVCGLRQFTPVNGEAIADPNDATAPPVALVSVAIENGPLDGLYAVTVTAKPNVSDATVLETVELVRWLIDPSVTEAASSEGAAL